MWTQIQWWKGIFTVLYVLEHSLSVALLRTLYKVLSHKTPAIIPNYPPGIITISELLSTRRPTPTDLYKAINWHCAIFSGQVQRVSAWRDCYGSRTEAEGRWAAEFNRWEEWATVLKNEKRSQSRWRHMGGQMRTKSKGLSFFFSHCSRIKS